MQPQVSIINFRKLKQDFAQNVLRDGKGLFEKKMIKVAEIVDMNSKVMKIRAQVQGVYANTYDCDVEINRLESQIVDARCGCPHTFDCQHIASLIFHLEEEMENMIVTFSKEKTPKKRGVEEAVDTVIRQAQEKVEQKQKEEQELHFIQEYHTACTTLGRSSFFVPDEELGMDMGELLFLFQPREKRLQEPSFGNIVELQFVLRLPFRSKPFYLQNPKQFLQALQAQEPFIIGQNRYAFDVDSFGPFAEKLLHTLRQNLRFTEGKQDKAAKIACLDKEGFGEFLAIAAMQSDRSMRTHGDDGRSFSLPSIFWQSIDNPIRFYEDKAELSCKVHLMQEPKAHIVLTPRVMLPGRSNEPCDVHAVQMLECTKPGVFHDGAYYQCRDVIQRQHIHDLEDIQKMSIPEALFGCFIENALPELLRFCVIENQEILDQLVTYPEEMKARCELSYVSGELEAKMQFLYGDVVIPESAHQLTIDEMNSFITKDGVLARNVCEENALIRELFHGFLREEKSGSYIAKTEKKIVEFMTEVLPRNRKKVDFSCPQSLLSQFIYDDTKIRLSLKEGARFDTVRFEMTVDGLLKGITCSHLEECVAAKKTYVVMSKKGDKFIRGADEDDVLHPSQKILVIKLALWERLLQVFDELSIEKVDDCVIDLPLWLFVNLYPERFQDLPVDYCLSEKLKAIQEQILNMDTIDVPKIPSELKATLRHYQHDGVSWLARLRHMGLNGILADDMGLGKTLQTICAIAQYKEACTDKKMPSTALIVCPTSLVDNWKEECEKFYPQLKVATLSGTPQERKKVIAAASHYDLLVTSYGLVQKDIELFEKITFSYLILDEAQCIKNRETRNARSVKKIPAIHRLVLTGTPLENSLADLWSLFDFLMPGFMGSFERFSQKYIRPTGQLLVENLTQLKKKIFPFVLRRMKTDVLHDLPPISHIVYHCHLTSVQEEIYRSYAKSAREELTKLVEREGFEKVQLHVLATLTRLKQICCHPAIFAKSEVVAGDSAKYEMLLDLIGNLIESKRKTVVFSQYTAMLGIMKEDMQKMGTKVAYLDGATKNRMSVVKQFNEDPDTCVFLVSLKAGGQGLNLVGADTVIHFDMWWNPAVENQATDRVWRMGQKQAVSSYKLVTLNTIEEKIIALQEKKKELLKDIVRTDEEVISKLSWKEVLDLLKT